MRVHLVSLSSDICEDDIEKGIGKSTGCGYSDEKIGKTFDTIEQMVVYLQSAYGLSGDKDEYYFESNGQEGQLQYSKTVANHSEAQNGGWFDPTPDELARWHAGKLMLYSEDYVIRWHYLG